MMRGTLGLVPRRVVSSLEAFYGAVKIPANPRAAGVAARLPVWRPGSFFCVPAYCLLFAYFCTSPES